MTTGQDQSTKVLDIRELLKFYHEIGVDFIEMDPKQLSQNAPIQINSSIPTPKTSPTSSTFPRKKARKMTADLPHQAVDPAASQGKSPEQDITATPDPDSSAEQDSLKAIINEISTCVKCALHRTRNHVVPGEGASNPKIMFIGEGPGEQEDRQGRPFVGDAGNLLDRIIEKMGFKRESVYIANIVKCRPPKNRTPHEAEAKACIPFLKRQVELLKPMVIVCLGKTATNFLLEADYAISRVRGKNFDYQGIPVIPTFHPSFILHQRSKEATSKAKWDVWNDMQKVLELLKSRSN